MAEAELPERDLDFLCDLSLVCKDFHAWVEPGLYRYIDISNSHPLNQIMASFLARGDRQGVHTVDDPIEFFKERAPSTQAVSLTPSTTTIPATPQTLEEMKFILVFLPDLKRLSINLSILGAKCLEGESRMHPR